MRRNKVKKSQKSKQIKTGCPNLLHISDRSFVLSSLIINEFKKNFWVMIRIRRKVLTAMHDRMPTFFIVTTSDLIGQDSKTTKKLGFKVHFVWCFEGFK